jgi:hypothetical protein
MHSQPPGPYDQQPPSGSWPPGDRSYQPQSPALYQPQSQASYESQGHPRHSRPPQQPYRRPQRLDSEEVVLAAPMSFTGSAQRLWKLTRSRSANVWANAATCTGVILLISVMWMAVLCWYFMFGLWLVPYRLIRRGQRKRHMQELRHREMLTMMQQTSQQQALPRSRGTLPPAGY